MPFRRWRFFRAPPVRRWPFHQTGQPPGPRYLWPREQVFQPHRVTGAIECLPWLALAPVDGIVAIHRTTCIRWRRLYRLCQPVARMQGHALSAFYRLYRGAVGEFGGGRSFEFYWRWVVTIMVSN